MGVHGIKGTNPPEDSKSVARKGVLVRLRPGAPKNQYVIDYFGLSAISIHCTK
jgi:hypothetical protein